MHFQQGITNVFGCNVQTDWRKYQLSKLNTHYIIRMTLNFTIDSIIDIEILSLILLFGDSIFLSYY